MDKAQVHITQHAVDKFVSETKSLGGGGNIPNPEQQIRRLFAQAKKQKMNAALIRRIMKNDFQNADYFVIGKWRFVITDNTMVTCERIIYNKPRERRH